MVREEPKKPRKTLLQRFRERSETKKKTDDPKKPQQEPILESNAAAGVPLPEDHPLTRLWARYSGLPAPCFSFDTPDAYGVGPERLPLISPDKMKDEMFRLGRLLEHSAEFRLGAIELEAENGGPDLDAEPHIYMTAGHVSAWVFAYPPNGKGKQLELEQIQKMLAEARVTYGINEELLRSLPGREDRYFHLFLIAKGDPPLDGKDGYVNDHFSRSSFRPLSFEDQGQVDFSTLELFQSAKKGDVICEIFPPTPCRDGHSVRDEIAYARAGQPLAVLPRGRNTELTEDGTALVATCDGHVEFNGRGFIVKPSTELVGNVDATSGDVGCMGDIHIHGDVCSGFAVRAMGTVTVDGVIESATVEAGGDLVVRKGVQGNGQAVLRANRSIYVRYMESCSVYARENVEAECIINCDVFSDGSVTACSGRGKIIGGQIRAAKFVRANDIGTRAEARTSIILGGRPFEGFEREMAEQEIRELERELLKRGNQPATPERQKQMAKLRVQISALRMKLGQLEKSLAEIDEQGSGPAFGRLMGCMVYPGVEITIGKAKTTVPLETPMCTATLRGGEVILLPDSVF